MEIRVVALLILRDLLGITLVIWEETVRVERVVVERQLLGRLRRKGLHQLNRMVPLG